MARVFARVFVPLFQKPYCLVRNRDKNTVALIKGNSSSWWYASSDGDIDYDSGYDNGGIVYQKDNNNDIDNEDGDNNDIGDNKKNELRC